MEKALPELITITDEQFNTLVEKVLATNHTKKVLAELVVQGDAMPIDENSYQAKSKTKSQEQANSQTINDFEKVLAELKRHGNNLNQVARVLNESTTFGEGAIKVMNECWKSYRTISTIRGDIINAFVQGERSKIKTE